jgi:hypothetical protein
MENYGFGKSQARVGEMSDKPLSENIGRYDAGKYLVTAAIWRTLIEGRYYDTYEIGIREKETGKFTLIQSENFNHQSVQEVANAIAHLIGMPEISGEHYTPEWCQEHFK